MRRLTFFAASMALIMALIIAGPLRGPAWAQFDAQLIQDVDSPARQPFLKKIQLEAVGKVSDTEVFHIPAGKRLVIETVSAYVRLENKVSPQVPWFWIQTLVEDPAIPGSVVQHYFPLTKQASWAKAGFGRVRALGETEIYMTCQPVRIYHDSGPEGVWNIQVMLTRDYRPPLNGALTGTITISGHLIDKTVGP